MSRGVCKVILIGWAGADGDLRYTPNGTPVLRIRIATETGVKRGSGQHAPDWHSVVVIGPKAEARENVVRRGVSAMWRGHSELASKLGNLAVVAEQKSLLALMVSSRCTIAPPPRVITRNRL